MEYVLQKTSAPSQIGELASLGAGKIFTGGPVRYEKAETILRIALDMQGTAEGLSLEDIRRNYSSKPLSRRTAERLRDAIERVFPQARLANPGELPKRWRLPAGTVSSFAGVSAEELPLRRWRVTAAAREHAGTGAKRRARSLQAARADEAGRPLTRCTRSRSADRSRGLGHAARSQAEDRRGGREYVAAGDPFDAKGQDPLPLSRFGQARFRTDFAVPGLLYGSRHYLVAWSENELARDFRNFSLSNIDRVELLGRAFRKRQFSLREYAERSFGIFRKLARRGLEILGPRWRPMRRIRLSSDAVVGRAA